MDSYRTLNDPSRGSGVSRRLWLQGGLATGLGLAGLTPGTAAAATAEQAWRSSYAPFDGPRKPPVEARNLAVQGRWPAGLRGTLYRVGPARRQLGGVALTHWFDGDGMVQAFRFDGHGKVSHRGALLATPKLLEEEAAGRLLYPGFGARVPDARPVTSPDQLNVANINLLPAAGGRDLYALWEAGSALAIDPQTLEAKGFKAWSPDTRGLPFSAHPRVAPDGAVWSFGYLPGSGRLVLYEIDPQGVLRRQHVMAAPQADMVHDFAITERYLVFLLMPLRFQRGNEVAADASFLQRYRWDAGAPLVAMLIDKADFSEVRRFELPGTGVFHLGNAWEQGGVVHVGFAEQPAILQLMHSLRVDAMAGAGALPSTQWVTLRLDVVSGRAVREEHGLADVEFPRFDPRVCGQASRFTVMLQRSARMNASVVGMDTVLALFGERVRRFSYGDGWIAEEHLFVPRSRRAREGEGWVLGTAYHWPSERTTLSVFDASVVGAGPVARVALPYGLPLGLHGQFVGG